MVCRCMVGIKNCIDGNSYTVTFKILALLGLKLLWNGRVIQQMLLITHIWLILIRISIIFKVW